MKLNKPTPSPKCVLSTALTRQLMAPTFCNTAVNQSAVTSSIESGMGIMMRLFSSAVHRRLMMSLRRATGKDARRHWDHKVLRPGALLEHARLWAEKRPPAANRGQ